MILNSSALNNAPLNGSTSPVNTGDPLPENYGLYRKTIRASSGLAISGAQVSVTYASGDPAKIWDEQGAEMVQPITTDISGTIAILLAYGAYIVTVASGQEIITLTDQFIGPDTKYVDDSVEALNQQLSSAMTAISPVGHSSVFVQGLQPEGWAEAGSVIQEIDSPILAPLITNPPLSYSLTGVGLLWLVPAAIDTDASSFVSRGSGLAVASYAPGQGTDLAMAAWSVVPSNAQDAHESLWDASGSVSFELSVTTEPQWTGKIAKTRRVDRVSYLRSAAPFYGVLHLDPNATNAGALFGGKVPSLENPTSDPSAPIDSPVESSLMSLGVDFRGAGTQYGSIHITGIRGMTDPASPGTVAHIHIISDTGAVRQTHRITGSEALADLKVVGCLEPLTTIAAATMSNSGLLSAYRYRNLNSNSHDGTAFLSTAPGSKLAFGEFSLHVGVADQARGLSHMAIHDVVVNGSTINIDTNSSDLLDLTTFLPGPITSWESAHLAESPVNQDPLYAAAVVTSNGQQHFVGYRRRSGDSGPELEHDQTFLIQGSKLELGNMELPILSIDDAYSLEGVDGLWFPVIKITVMASDPEDGDFKVPVLYAPLQRILLDGELLLPSWGVELTEPLKAYIKYR